MVPQILAQIFGEARARGEGNVVLGKPGTFGLPPKKSGSILRSKVCSLRWQPSKFMAVSLRGQVPLSL